MGLLTEVQHTDITQNPAAARAALIAALRRIDAAAGSAWPDDRSPFPGLRPFDSDWHRVFLRACRRHQGVSGAGEVAFAPDGNTLATASSDRTVILWDLTCLNHLRDHAVERACAIAGEGLDRDEWARYLSGLPYQDTCST